MAGQPFSLAFTVVLDEDEDAEAIANLPDRFPPVLIVANVCGHAEATWTDFVTMIALDCPVCGQLELIIDEQTIETFYEDR